MKKMIGLVLALVMVLSCTSFAMADDAVTLRFWMWDDAQVPAIQAMADEYTAAHPNVKIEISCQADVSGLNQKIQATIGTTDAPEIFFINYNLAAEYIPLGIVADLSSYEIDQSELASGIVNAYTVDDKVYAVAKDTDSYAVFYNKSLFDAAGVAYPENDWTIEDFCETAKNLTSDGVVGWTNSGSDRVYYNFIYSNGGEIYSADGTASAINTPEAAEPIQALMNLVSEGYAYTGPQLSEVSDTTAFTSGIAAMTINGSWMISQYATALGDNLGIVELPSGKAGKFSSNHGIGYATTAANEHMDETVDFLRYLATYEAQVKQIEVVIPANLTCASDWENVYPNVNVGAFMNALSYGRGYLSTVNATLARTAYQETLASLRNGDFATAEEFCAAAEQAVNDALAE
ncbi:MAG: sugar ABC transporter substrate-binding protein [Eubacteriales bacterium]|nr:sugar ABC transporter substrate-binding protein [Eubacteriales bacterium]